MEIGTPQELPACVFSYKFLIGQLVVEKLHRVPEKGLRYLLLSSTYLLPTAIVTLCHSELKNTEHEDLTQGLLFSNETWPNRSYLDVTSVLLYKH